MMRNYSRTQYSIINVSSVLIIQIITSLVGLISRTIFVKVLGNDYLSVNGLFNDVLTLLSFTEMGVGSAIVFSLYKPIAEKNEEKIVEILKLFKTAYRAISAVILCLGIAIIPFLNKIISDIPSVSENIKLLYILFLANTVCSYWWSYRNSFLIADQKNYIVSFVQQVVKIIFVGIQILLLFLFGNYVLYLVVSIASTLVMNYTCHIYTSKQYAFLAKYKDSQLPKNERKEIFSNVKSLFVYRLGATLLNGTDNVIISSVLKTSFVGLCSNYTLIINTINTVLMQMCNSIAASIGNHNVESTPFDREIKFKQIDSLNSFLFSFSAICLVVLLNPLIIVWLGNNYLLDIPVVVALALSFYVTGSNQIASLYRTTLGLFQKAKMIPFTAAIINIVLSIILGKYIGLLGVFVATSISKLLTFNLFDPILIYKYGFEKTPSKYFMRKIVRFVFNIGITIFVTILVSLVHMNGFKGLLIKTLVCGAATLLLLLVFYIFDVNFRLACVKIFKNLTRKRIRRL